MKEKIILAAEKGDLPTIKNLIALGADINTKNSFDENLLFLACRHGHLDTVLFLLANNADLHQLNSGRQSTIHAACLNGNLEIVKALIAAGTDISQLTSARDRAVSYAIKYNHIGIIDYFIKQGFLKPDEKTMDDLASSLISNSRTISIDTIGYFIGQNFLKTDEKTIDRIVGGLITSDRDISEVMGCLFDKFPDIKNRWQIHFMDLLYSFELVSKTGKKLAINPTKSITFNKYVNETIFYSYRNPILEFLLKNGLQFDSYDNQGETLLHHAAAYQLNEYEEIGHLHGLLSLGHPIDIVNSKGQSPLHVAIAAGMFFHAFYLIYYGANVNLVDKNGETPLSLASNFCVLGFDPDYEENLEMRADLIQILKDYGAQDGPVK